MVNLQKPSATARKKAKLAGKARARVEEETNKRAAKKRDGFKCRFPMCGCAKIGLRLESAHWPEHKGMGGNPSGDRSQTPGLVTLCSHRHQHGPVSLHKGTLRAVFMEPARGFDSLIAWEIDCDALLPGHVEMRQHNGCDRWMPIARERMIGEWEPPVDDRQQAALELLSEMDR